MYTISEEKKAEDYKALKGIFTEAEKHRTEQILGVQINFLRYRRFEVNFDNYTSKDFAEIIIDAESENNSTCEYTTDYAMLLAFKKVHNQLALDPEMKATILSINSRFSSSFSVSINLEEKEFIDKIMEIYMNFMKK